MKRLIALVLMLCMLISLASCASGGLTDLDATSEENTTAENSTKEEGPKGPITLPEGFSVGYARKDMSPVKPVLTYEGAVTNQIHDPVQITCVSVSDGEEVALFYTLDLRQSPTELIEKSMEIIEKKYAEFGIGKDSMFFTSTHTHSAPDAGNSSAAGVATWRKLYYEKLREVTEESLRDLAPAEAFVGKGNTEDISFVRRLITSDGKVTTDSTLDVVGYESQADTELRTIRFDRKDKKDVLMVNYQTHYGVATRYFGKNAVSADFVHDFRKAAEEELDMHFAYYQGAAGCITFSALKGDRVYDSYMDAIPAFMHAAREALDKETKVKTGKIQKELSVYEGTVRKDDPAKVEAAYEVCGEQNAGTKQQLIVQKGFYNLRDAEAHVQRDKLGATKTTPFTAITFGDIGFVSAAYEMFHQNAIQVRAESPFKMTFVCAYTNGSNGYVPAWECTPEGSQYDVEGCYENYITLYKYGSGEEFANEMIRLLNVCKAK